MKNKTTILIILLSLLVLLISIDLLTGIWYWNKLHLVFNSSSFNNIIAPLSGLAAVVIYTLALFTTMKQNKIILSQTIKPHFENDINELKVEGENTKIQGILLQYEQEYNILNYLKLISKAFKDLENDMQFKEDLIRFSGGKEKISPSYFENRSYFDKVLTLNSFMIGDFSIEFFYKKIAGLIEEVDKSKLILDDKIYLKKRIHRFFLMEYLAFVSFMDNNPNFFPAIPMVVTTSEFVEYQYLNKSEFRKHYKLLKKLLVDI